MQFERKKNPPLFLVLGDKESAIGGDPTLNLMNKKEKKKEGRGEGGVVREGGVLRIKVTM